MADSFRPHTVTPASYREFARVLAGAVSAGRTVRVRGGGTKLGWGATPPEGTMHISTARLTEARFTPTTATFGAGTPLASVHGQLARRGRLLGLDPPLGPAAARRTVESPGATLGGVLATADSGPLSHGLGGPRDQVIDLLAALPDGSLIRASEHPDEGLLTLLTGSMGTLAAILEVTLLTHPLPPNMVTVLGTSTEADAIAAGATAITDSPIGAVAVDCAWHGGAGGLLVLLPVAPDHGSVVEAEQLLRDAGVHGLQTRAGADAVWARQRAGQRSADRVVVRVNAPRDRLPAVLGIADRTGATTVGRAALGCSYLTLDANQVDVVRTLLPDGSYATVTDAPSTVRGVLDLWGAVDDVVLTMMRGVKRRFDPGAACNRGVFIGGI